MYSVAFAELTRQVSVGCVERGRLLARYAPALCDPPLPTAPLTTHVLFVSTVQSVATVFAVAQSPCRGVHVLLCQPSLAPARPPHSHIPPPHIWQTVRPLREHARQLQSQLQAKAREVEDAQTAAEGRITVMRRLEQQVVVQLHSVHCPEVYSVPVSVAYGGTPWVGGVWSRLRKSRWTGV